MVSLIIINTTIFLALSALHVYWAFGGRWSLRAAVPTLHGKPVLKTTPGSCLFVATGLLIFAVITIGNIGVFRFMIETRYIHIGTLIIAFIFLARAVGDFKYVGFFKKVTNTPFAINDFQLYSPLCLGLAVVSVIIVFLS